MKNKKVIQSSNTRGSILNLEKFSKWKEIVTMEYKDMLNIIKSHETIINNFPITSGKVVLTSVGNKELCTRIIWSFPLGNHDVYIHNDKEMYSIFIPFKDFKSKTIRYPIYFDTFHLPGQKIIPQFIRETEALNLIGDPFYLMDEELWHKFKSTLYTKEHKTNEEIIKEMNKENSGFQPMITINDNSNSKIKETKNFIQFYIACCGYTMDGALAYFWLLRIKQFVQ